MKALVLREDAFGLQDIHGPVAPTMVDGPYTTIHVACAALNHRDQYIREGKYAKIQHPAILGSDVAGWVADEHDQVDRTQLVIVDPSLGWSTDENAQAPSMTILGMPSQGGFAERVIVPAANVHAAPAHLSAEEAAALPLAGVTAWRALMRQGQCTPQDVVVVTGIGGGVSTMAMQFARALGCTVVVTSRSQEKLDRMPADVHTIAMDDDGAWINALKAYHPTLAIDSIGGAVINGLMDALQPGGRIACYGASAGAPPNFNLHRLFWKQIHLDGSTMGSPSDFAAMLSFVSAHGIVPTVDSVVPFANIVSAFDRMQGASQLGKIVVRIA